MFRKFITKKRAALLGAVAVLALAGGAYAYFTSTGSGTGAASVGSASNWTVAVSSDSTEAIYPGAGEEILTYKVTNAGSGHQNLESTTSAVASKGGNITEGGVEVAGCKASWFSAENHAPTLPHDLAHGEEVEGTVKVKMADAAENQNACQKKKPDITVEAK